MHITELQFRRTNEGEEFSARLGDFVCCYRLPPGAVANASGDAFLAAGLLAAMALREPLELDPQFTASPALLDGLEQIQRVFATWVPELERVPVVARTAPPPPARPGAASFFSGGADSLYTFLEMEGDISRAVHIRGFDYRRERAALAEEVDQRNRSFVEARGRCLTVVESNLRELYDALRLHVFLYHGSHLASVALTVGFERVYVPASFTWATLVPWGSHPLTDPLWGNGAVRLVHHGAEVARTDKLRRIGREADALALLRVCPGFWDYSCGVCEKCLRTRVALRLLGLKSPNLPPLDSAWSALRLRIDSDRSRVNWAENHRLARASGDRALEWVLGLALAGYDVRRATWSVDDALLGGIGRATWRGLGRVLGRQPPSPPTIRIDAAG
jgi:hypothetical protein